MGTLMGGRAASSVGDDDYMAESAPRSRAVESLRYSPSESSEPE